MGTEIHYSTGDNEHYTPHDLLNRVLRFYDDLIDLDPCSNSKDNPNTPCRHAYTIDDDGLKQDWFGKVFVNPPYGRSLFDWSEKVVSEYKASRAKQILYLVPSRTDTQWYKLLTEYPRCNIHGRLKFLNNKNNGNSAPFPSVIFYLGRNKQRFESYFSPIGEILTPFDRRSYMREYMAKKRSR